MTGLKQQTFDSFDNGGKMCPILDYPQPNCYCIDMTSMKIPYAVKYCLRDFRECEIYQTTNNTQHETYNEQNRSTL